MLAAVAPPYAPSFAAWLLRLIAGAKAQRDHNRGAALTAALTDFAAAAQRCAFVPPLALREQQLLGELLQPHK